MEEWSRQSAEGRRRGAWWIAAPASRERWRPARAGWRGSSGTQPRCGDCGGSRPHSRSRTTRAAALRGGERSEVGEAISGFRWCAWCRSRGPRARTPVSAAGARPEWSGEAAFALIDQCDPLTNDGCGGSLARLPGKRWRASTRAWPSSWALAIGSRAAADASPGAMIETERALDCCACVEDSSRSSDSLSRSDFESHGAGSERLKQPEARLVVQAQQLAGVERQGCIGPTGSSMNSTSYTPAPGSHDRADLSRSSPFSSISSTRATHR